MKTKINDTIAVIIISGSIATIVQMIISWTFLLLGLIQQNPSIFHARLLTNKYHVGFAEILLGIVGNFIAGIAFAGIIIIVLKFTGIDYAIMKGASIGIINAMLQFYVLARLFHNPILIIPDLASIVHTYIVYIFWGALVAYISSRYFLLKTS